MTGEMIRLFSVVHRQSCRYLDKKLKKHGLGSGQALFLSVLFESDGISQEELAEKLCIDKGTTARAMDRLEKAGLIRRTVYDADRRIKMIELTDLSRELKSEVEEALLELESHLIYGLDPFEKGLMGQMLEKTSEGAEMAARRNA